MSGITRSNGNSVFNFLKTCQNDLQSVYKIFAFPSVCMRAPISPYPCKMMLLSDLLIITNPNTCEVVYCGYDFFLLYTIQIYSNLCYPSLCLL